jgi:5-formyltetrahydrofolate cyclo-ligase
MSDAEGIPPSALFPREAKSRLRSTIRTARHARSPRRQAQAAVDLADVVDTIPHLTAADCVAVYVSQPGEPGTGEILNRLASRGVRVLLPVLGAGLSRSWADYRSPEDLAIRAPGRPPEPSSPTLGAQALHDAEVILVPALAVDTTGARLGQGGGWYDRALDHARPDAAVVALVYPEEVYPASAGMIPVEDHDRRVGFVATPQGWRSLG